MADLSDNTNWFETDASNNKASPNGWPEGMMPSGVNDSARGDKGALKRFWDRINPVQTIAPASGLWQFTTANSAYPTGYIDGEIYSFKATAFSVGGDQFQVNALGVKPIWRLNGTPIIANDIVSSGAPQIIYQAALNGGAGAFLLLNPYVAIGGDGSGGITVPTGNLNVVNDISGHTITASGGMNITAGGLTVTGGISSANDISGHTITASGGMVVNAGGLDVVSGGATINGNLNMPNDIFCHGLTASGGITVAAGGANIAGGLTVTGGNLTVSGPSTFTQPVTFQGRVFVTADFLTCVGLAASGDVNAVGVYRCNGAHAGARIECFGGDWGFMTFAISSGSLVISPDNGSSGFIFGPGTGFSDARLKDNIHDTKVDALAAICATPVREFEWNEEGRKLMPHIDPMVPCGLVAQELEETMPFAVGVAPLADGMRHIIDQNVTPYLMRAIQQLETRVTELEGRLARE